MALPAQLWAKFVQGQLLTLQRSTERETELRCDASLSLRRGLGAAHLDNGYRRTMLTQPLLRENRNVRSIQYATSVIVLSAISIGVALLLPTHGPGGSADDLQARAIEAQQVHNADLPLLYSQINRQYFSDQLPDYVSVSWADLVANKDCTSCAGMTDWDTGFLRIRLDPTSVRSEKFLREAMEHEMCHVATVDAATKAHQDFHGPLFQACMLRYETPEALTSAGRWPAR